jgi:hypothetical protein
MLLAMTRFKRSSKQLRAARRFDPRQEGEKMPPVHARLAVILCVGIRDGLSEKVIGIL